MIFDMWSHHTSLYRQQSPGSVDRDQRGFDCGVCGADCSVHKAKVCLFVFYVPSTARSFS